MALLSTDRITAPVFMTGGKYHVWNCRLYRKTAGDLSFWMGFPSWNTEAMTLPGSLFLMVKKIHMEKAVGRLRVLDEKINHGALLPGFCGIGHTRWATHGCPSDTNAHPHMNEEHTIAVVHNGIIENYEKLKQRLEKKGYRFVSETDTEVLAHMLTEYYRGDPVEAIEKVMHRVEGFLCSRHHVFGSSASHLRCPQGQPADRWHKRYREIHCFRRSRHPAVYPDGLLYGK